VNFPLPLIQHVKGDAGYRKLWLRRQIQIGDGFPDVPQMGITNHCKEKEVEIKEIVIV
jgi:hypothetical protein